MKRGGCADAPDNTGKLNGREKEVQQCISHKIVSNEGISGTLGWSTKQEQL